MEQEHDIHGLAAVPEGGAAGQEASMKQRRLAPEGVCLAERRLEQIPGAAVLHEMI
jgi:hypothetical protein